MIVLVLLLVLVLFPVLVLHDFSAGGLYSYSCEWRCQHLRCDSVCKHDFFEPFFGLSKILLHFNPPDYSCKTLTGYIFCILTWIVTVCPPLPAAVGESQSLVSSPRSSPESSVHDVRDTPESHIVEETLLSETLLKLWNQEIKRTPLSVSDIVEGNLTLWNFCETMKPRRHRDTLHIEQRLLPLKSL